MTPPATELSKAYSPADVEKRWLDYWLENGCFHADDISDRPPYCIVIPPPNVTGILHMGHAMDITLQDILIRWKRMSGFNALWMPGTDHAGIATELVMEQRLAGEGLSRYDIGRDDFLARMWEWKEHSRDTIIGQLERLGASCDWERERFTFDEGFRKAVPHAFKRLYDAGLIYRGEEMVNWVPRLQTSVSDLEVDHEERSAHLYYVRYPVDGWDGELIIATTRPETMLGDTAIAVHPEDERYSHLVGKTATLPLIGRELPIISDEYVDREFGTGALKITPGHDPNDFEIGKRHGLLRVDILNADATINANGGPYEGLDRYECRERVLEDLRSEGLLVKTVPYTHTVGLHDATKDLIEPRVVSGWFMRMKPLAERSIQAAERGEIRFVPENQKNIFLNWMRGIRDWSLDRQRWWGHPVPAWYTPDGEVFVAETEDAAYAAARKAHGEDVVLNQDPNVLDTWFSSMLWPAATLGWPEKTDAFNTFYPTNVLVTGWDILFFWVSRMVNLGIELTGQRPFEHVYLHPLLRGEDGRKMSKSRGNVIDPLELMGKYGTDAFRFAIASCMIEAPWMQLPEGRIQGYRNFTNKLWNAARFVLMNLDDFEPDPTASLCPTLADRWVLARLHTVIADVTLSLDRFRFADAAASIYEFVWHEYCDWYIEFAKVALYDEDNRDRAYTAKHVLNETLDGILRLLHPFMPFITEEIWQHLPIDGDDLCTASYPTVDAARVDKDAEREMSVVMETIHAIRNVRGEMNIPSGTSITVLAHGNGAWERQALIRHEEYVEALAKVSDLDVAETHEKPAASATAIAGSIEMFIPLEGVLDISEELRRLERELGRIESELGKVARNLENPQFVDRAPADVVEKQRARVSELESGREALGRHVSLLGEL